MAHKALPAVVGALVGMSRKEARYFGFDRLNEQRSCALAQKLGSV